MPISIFDTASFSLPEGWRDYSAITLTDAGGVEQDPLFEIAGGINEFRRFKSNDAATGTPRQYVIQGDTVFLWRVSNGVYTVKQEYTKDHAQDVDAIEFKDIFKNAINYGTTYHVALFRKKVSYIDIWLPNYVAAKQKRVNSRHEQPSIARGQIWTESW